MTRRETVVWLPTEEELENGVDAWELLPELAGLWGTRVAISVIPVKPESGNVASLA